MHYICAVNIYKTTCGMGVWVYVSVGVCEICVGALFAWMRHAVWVWVCHTVWVRVSYSMKDMYFVRVVQYDRCIFGESHTV